jgi:hypothetical protein
VEFDQVADELYAVPPEEFVARRTELRDDARADGDKALAAAIAALPKPSIPAWVCNLLVRAHRAEIEGLVELGDLLRNAQNDLAGDELKTLNRQRGQLLTALSRQAAALAREQGHAVSSAISGQVEETLRAAMADPEAGEALLSGRLTAPMSYSGGLGTGGRRPDLRVVRAPEPASPPARRKAPAGDDAEQRRREREEERRRAAREQRRRAIEVARRALEEAEEAAEEARAAAEEERRAAAAADDRNVRTRARVAELSEQLAQAEADAAEADAGLKRAERRRRTAEREAADAESALDAARSHLVELERAE